MVLPGTYLGKRFPNARHRQANSTIGERMANYKDVMNRKEVEAGAWLSLLPELEGETPNVRDMLTGLYDDLGNQTVKGASLTFWLDGARLKFVIRPKDQTLLGWGVCKDPAKPWHSIELALMKEEIDWKEAVNTRADNAPY